MDDAPHAAPVTPGADTMNDPGAVGAGTPPPPAGARPARAGRFKRDKPNAPASLVPPAEAPPIVTDGMPPLIDPTSGIFEPAKVAGSENLWWVNRSGDTFFISHRGAWLEWSRAALGAYLKSRGLSNKGGAEGQSSEVERLLVHLRTHRVLFGALDALAGYHAGIHDLGEGRKMLVRQSPSIIEPAANPSGWPIIASFLHGLLGPTATGFFLAWLRLAYLGLINGTRDRGQVLIVAGPPGCGKSRIQHQIITPVLGGRHADPTAYLFGEDRFNADLSVGEHLLCEDPAVVLKAETRAHLKERLKSISVADSFRVAAKYQSACTLTPFWRVSITINDDPDALKLLPQLTPDWRDKVILLQARAGAMPMPTETPEQRKAFRQAIEREIPSMLAEITSEEFWIAYPHTRGGRFGSLHYADPDLAMRLCEGTPAELLLALIDDFLFTADGGLLRDHGTPWEGRSDELESTLTSDSSPVAPSARKLLNRSDCARMLGRLAEDHPTRVERARTENKRWWRIFPPGPAVDSTPQGEAAA